MDAYVSCYSVFLLCEWDDVVVSVPAARKICYGTLQSKSAVMDKLYGPVRPLVQSTILKFSLFFVLSTTLGWAGEEFQKKLVLRPLSSRAKMVRRISFWGMGDGLRRRDPANAEPPLRHPRYTKRPPLRSQYCYSHLIGSSQQYIATKGGRWDGTLPPPPAQPAGFENGTMTQAMTMDAYVSCCSIFFRVAGMKL